MSALAACFKAPTPVPLVFPGCIWICKKLLNLLIISNLDGSHELQFVPLLFIKRQQSFQIYLNRGGNSYLQILNQQLNLEITTKAQIL